MGGFGSGRQRRYGKETTSDLRRLDVRRLHRDGLLSPGPSFIWQWTLNDEVVGSVWIRSELERVTLAYRTRIKGGDWQQVHCTVEIAWTIPHFGGRRAWFVCPSPGCGRRVAILYGGMRFACRHCHNLAYACQREAHDDRAMRRAERIRERLGWALGIANLNGGKPKGMHWKTYHRLRAEHDTYADAAWRGFSSLVCRAGGW